MINNDYLTSTLKNLNPKYFRFKRTRRRRVIKMNTAVKEEKIYLDQIQKLSGHTILGISATLINSLVLSLILWNVVPKMSVVIWFILSVAVSSVRYFLQKRYSKLTPTLETAKKWKKLFLLTLALSGAVWGSAAIFLFPWESIGHQVFIVFVLGGMVAGSVGVFSVVITAFFAFSIPTLLPILILFLNIKDEIHIAMGFMLFLFWLIMLLTAKSLNKTILSSLSLTHENIDLVSGLQAEIEERVKIEKDLLRKNEEIEGIVEARTSELKDINKKLIEEIEVRKNTENAFRESEERYVGLFERSLELVYLCDFEGNFIDANNAALEGLGYTKKEINSLNFMSFLDKNQVPRAFEMVEEILKTGSQKEVAEFKLRRKDGEHIYVESKGALITRDGKPFAVQGIARDVTARRQIQKELRESEVKYRSMMNAMKDAVYICSPDYRIEYMNPEMISSLGRDATGEMCFKAIHNLNKICTWCMHHKIFQNESFEYDIISPRNNKHYHITNAPIVHEDGSISKMTVSRDTTDYIKIREQLLQGQKMESIGTLAGGIAHDFNNILSSIIGFTELALDDVEKNTNIEDSLQEVYTAGKRAKDLVKQILAFARQSDEEIKPIRLSVIAKEVLNFIRSSIPTTIEIRQNIASDHFIKGSATQAHQILMNLCTNAAQAMEDDGGVLHVDLTDVRLDADFTKTYDDLTPGDYLKLSVSDTGSGIAPENIESIFEPYFTTKAPGEGTGMGLATVFGIVKQYGGEIMVESRVNKGSTFNVYLPVTKKLTEAEPYQKEELPSGNERILVIDDELPIAKMSSQILQRLGYHVNIRTSSIEAMNFFRAKPKDFDLVITDMTMPNMTGDKLTGELMKIRSDIPVILCTGYSKKISEETAKDIGIKAFVYKPIVKADFAKTVRKVLDESKSSIQQ
jgi:PAS domain S-box-containing protein